MVGVLLMYYGLGDDGIIKVITVGLSLQYFLGTINVNVPMRYTHISPHYLNQAAANLFK